MNTNTIKNRLLEKLNTLSEAELNTVLLFVEQLEHSGEDEPNVPTSS